MTATERQAFAAYQQFYAATNNPVPNTTYAVNNIYLDGVRIAAMIPTGQARFQSPPRDAPPSQRPASRTNSLASILRELAHEALKFLG